MRALALKLTNLKMNKITRLVESGITLSGTYAYKEIDLSSLGSITQGGKNQIAIHFVLSQVGGETLTFAPQELFSYLTSAVEQIGWSPREEDDGTNLTAVERTTTQAVTTYYMSSMADKIRVGVKGSGTLAVYISIGLVE
jgi:hypothetical protein